MSEGVSPLVGTLRRARAVAVARVVAGGFEVLSRVGGATPLARPERYGAELAGRDLPYGPHPRQRVDIYRPVEASGPAPVLVYFHGGGFRAMSKDTHWLMALRFARAGFVVVNVDYRLAPESPFPAAAQDACAAIRLAVDLAGRYGGDPTRLLIAGESAGANLTAVATIACCFERPEPWARDVYKLGLVPRASLPACGILQVSDTERFTRAKPLPLISRDALRDPEAAYLKRSLSGEESEQSPWHTALRSPAFVALMLGAVIMAGLVFFALYAAQQRNKVAPPAAMDVVTQPVESRPTGQVQPGGETPEPGAPSTPGGEKPTAPNSRSPPTRTPGRSRPDAPAGTARCRAARRAASPRTRRSRTSRRSCTRPTGSPRAPWSCCPPT